MMTPQLKLAPGPRGLEILRVLGRLGEAPLDELLALQQRYGNIIRAKAPMIVHAVFHPEYVQHVLKDNAKNYTKGREMEEIKPMLGEGLLTAEGEHWRKQRRTISAQFHINKMKQYSQSVLNHTQKLLENWELNYSDDQQIEVTAEFHALALSIASEAFFGVQIGKAQMIADVLKVCGELASDRLRSIVKFPRWLPFPRHLRASQAIQKMDEVVNDLILTYRRHPTENNVLANLIGTRDPESQSLMEDQQLRDEIVTLLLASHDTTTCTLAWVVYCLGKNPEVEKRVYDEIYTTLGHCPPTYEDLEKIKYLKWVIQETLRLYPAFANLSREAISDDEIDGYSIQKGSMVNCSQYVTHRLEEFWSEPHKFDPERFCPERSIGRHPFAYYPFGRGARACVGEHFAMMEIQLILIQLLQKYQLCLVPEHAVIASPRITLFTKSGIKVVLKKRKN